MTFRRLKEKYESEIEFTNDEVTMHKNKFNKLRDEYASKEEETIVLQAVVKTKEVQMAEMQKVSLDFTQTIDMHYRLDNTISFSLFNQLTNKYFQ